MFNTMLYPYLERIKIFFITHQFLLLLHILYVNAIHEVCKHSNWLFETLSYSFSSEPYEDENYYSSLIYEYLLRAQRSL